MNDTAPKTAFLAVLVFENRPGWRCEEPRVYHANHPEIAYQLALAEGREHRYGRRFLGLSRLEVARDNVESLVRSTKGDAAGLVVEKEQLAAFADPRWQGTTCDPNELASSLEEPPQVVDIEGLEAVPWYEYSHAYGSAAGVPKDIRRLVSSDPKVRGRAFWELFGSIYHQGTLYSATAVAVPFLIRLVQDRRVPDRANVCELLAAIAESTVIDPDKLREAWAWRGRTFGETYSKPTVEMAEDEIANRLAVRRVFLSSRDAIERLRSDGDPMVAERVRELLSHLQDREEVK
jgi:hypothetical protein